MQLSILAFALSAAVVSAQNLNQYEAILYSKAQFIGTSRWINQPDSCHVTGPEFAEGVESMVVGPKTICYGFASTDCSYSSLKVSYVEGRNYSVGGRGKLIKAVQCTSDE